MPDIVIHTKMGRAVLERLDLAVEWAPFSFGVLGPDPLLFYRFNVPPFRHAANFYSSTMHRRRTGDFLIELAKRAGDGRTFAYLAGFLCHYALDSRAHPYIIQTLAKGNSGMHIAIEHRLDVQEGSPVVIPPFPDDLEGTAGEAMRAVYGWPDVWRKLREGYRDMPAFYKLVEAEAPFMQAAVGLMGGPEPVLVYTGRRPAQDMSGFWPLYELAVEDAVRFITAADAFARGDLDEAGLRGIIGNRSYIEG